MAFKEYMDKMVEISHSPITFDGEVPNALSRWLVRTVQTDGQQLWDTQPYLNTRAEIVLPFQQAFLSTEEIELNWRFYISTLLDRYQEVNAPNSLFTIESNKYMYALTNVYCGSEQDILVNIITFMAAPLRVWINGELVFTGTLDYLLKDYFFIFRFKEGNNTVLVESPLLLTLPLSHQEFIVKLNPLDALVNNSNHEFIDREFVQGLKQDFSIFPEKVFYSPDETIHFIVLPQYFHAQEVPITVTAYNALGEVLNSISSVTSRRLSLSFNQSLQGVLQLKVEDERGHSSLVYVYYGDLLEQTALLLEKAERRQDSNKALAETLRESLEIQKAFKSINQYVTGDIYRGLFEKIARFQLYIASPDGSIQKTYQGVYGSHYTVFDRKSTEDGYFAYNVHLPDEYEASNKYPLVIYFHDAQARYYPVSLPWMVRSSFTEAIIIDVVGIGRLNYVNDVQMIQKISELVAVYPVDRERIYGIGFCVGTYKAYRIAFEVPDLFAGVASLVGDMRFDVNNPEYEQLANIDNTMVYGLCSIENWFFNSSRKLNYLKRLKKSKSWVYSSFMHNEFNSLNNSKALFQKLILEKRERFPRIIHFVVLEPGYNKSHWIKVEYMEDLHIQAQLTAEIRFNHLIEISTNNITRFTVLLNLKEMSLNQEVEWVVNNRRQTILLSDYSSVLVTLQSDHSFSLELTALTLESFNQAYDSIGVEDALLGIKQIYIKKCTIVKPDRRKGNGSSFETKLAYLLQNPMKDRYIYYKYDAISQQELELGNLTPTNLVHIIDLRTMSQSQDKLLNSLGLRMDAFGMNYQDEQVKGDFFTFIKCDNPLFKDQYILIVAFNSDSFENELIQLMNSFDSNPIFFYDAFLFHRGVYQSFRNHVGYVLT